MLQKMHHDTNDKSKRKEGNIDMYDSVNLIQRERLFTHPQVLSRIEKWWEATLKCDDSTHTGTLNKSEYKTFHARLAKAFDDDEDNCITPEMERIVFEEDWLMDSRGSLFIDHEKFVHSVFQLVDNWCDTVDVEEYCEFLEGFFPKVYHEETIDHELYENEAANWVWSDKKNLWMRAAKHALNLAPRNTVMMRGYAELELQKLHQLKDSEANKNDGLGAVDEDSTEVAGDDGVTFKVFDPNALRKRRTMARDSLARRTFGIGGQRPSILMQKRLTMLAGNQDQAGMRRFTGIATSNNKARQARAKVHEAAKAIQRWWRNRAAPVAADSADSESGTSRRTKSSENHSNTGQQLSQRIRTNQHTVQKKQALANSSFDFQFGSDLQPQLQQFSSRLRPIRTALSSMNSMGWESNSRHASRLTNDLVERRARTNRTRRVHPKRPVENRSHQRPNARAKKRRHRKLQPYQQLGMMQVQRPPIRALLLHDIDEASSETDEQQEAFPTLNVAKAVDTESAHDILDTVHTPLLPPTSVTSYDETTYFREDTANADQTLIIKPLLDPPATNTIRKLPKALRPESAPAYEHLGDARCITVTKLSKLSPGAEPTYIINPEVPDPESEETRHVQLQPIRPSTANIRRPTNNRHLDTAIDIRDSDMVNTDSMTVREISQIRPYMSAMATAVMQAEAYDRRQIRRNKLKLRREQRNKTSRLPCLQRLATPKDAKRNVRPASAVARTRTAEIGYSTSVTVKSTHLLGSQVMDSTGRNMGPLAFRQLVPPVNSALSNIGIDR